MIQRSQDSSSPTKSRHEIEQKQLAWNQHHTDSLAALRSTQEKQEVAFGSLREELMTIHKDVSGLRDQLVSAQISFAFICTVLDLFA